jgi:hypothetical protein
MIRPQDKYVEDSAGPRTPGGRMSTLTMLKGEQELMSLSSEHKFLIFTYRTETLTLTSTRLVRQTQGILTDIIHSAPFSSVDSVIGGRQFQSGWFGVMGLGAFMTFSGMASMVNPRESGPGVFLAILGFLIICGALYKGRERLVGAFVGVTALTIDVSPQHSSATPENIAAFVETLIQLMQDVRTKPRERE